VVSDDVDEAFAQARSGIDVVLIVPVDAPPIRVPPDADGRVAVLVGDPTDLDVRRAAEAMNAELFCDRTQVTHTIRP
jgi:hypothetical protein